MGGFFGARGPAVQGLGGGFFGQTPVSGGGGGGGSFGLSADTISSSCPTQYMALPALPVSLFDWGGIPCGCFNDFSQPFASLTATLTPQIPSINGHPLLVFALVTDSPNWVAVCLSGVLPQNTWTSMAVDGLWGETYLSANAVQFDNATWAGFGDGITIWLFQTNLDPFAPNFLFFRPFTVTFT